MKAHLSAATKDMVADISSAMASNDEKRVTLFVHSLGQSTGGVAVLRDENGVVLAQSKEREPDIKLLSGAGSSVNLFKDRGELVLWQAVSGPAGKRIAELILRVPLPLGAAFSWRLWAEIIGLFSLASALLLYLVTKVLAPLGALGQFLRDLATKSPLDVSPAKKGFAEYAQLREDIEFCIEGLREKQLKIEEAFVEVAISLAREYEFHREGNSWHSCRTRRFAAWLAESLELSPEEKDALEVAALCHDIGKGSGGGDVFWCAVENDESSHPMRGSDIFRSVPDFEDVAEIILHHHENFDGSGYPHALAEENIPLGARILRIADCFERQLSGADDEPMSPELALDELGKGSGREFDPKLLRYFREEATIHMVKMPQSPVLIQPQDH